MKISKEQLKRFSALLPMVAMVFMDQTILPVAIPKISQGIPSSSTSLQWTVNAYLLCIMVFVLLGGKLSDRFGGKKTLLLGVLGFVVSSILCSLSLNAWMLVIARGLQGISAAFMLPSQTRMVASIFPIQERGKATGFIMSFGAIFLILGPLIGGYFTEIGSWRAIFWINVPIGMIGAFIIYKFLPTLQPIKVEIDWLGFTLFGVGISCLTIFFMQASDWGFFSKSCITVLSISIFSLLLLAIREKKISTPFLEFKLFKNPLFTSININVTTLQFTAMVSVFRAIYFQNTLGYSPLQVGSMLFFANLPTLFTAPIAGYLADKYTPRLPIAIGYFLLIITCLCFGFLPNPPFWLLNLILVGFAMGSPSIFTPSYAKAVASVPAEKAGTALGMLTTLRMLGGTMGLSLIYLFASKVQEKNAPIIGETNASILSFSYVHFGLVVFLLIAYTLAFVIQNRKSSHTPPSSPSQGWD